MSLNVCADVFLYHQALRYAADYVGFTFVIVTLQFLDAST